MPTPILKIFSGKQKKSFVRDDIFVSEPNFIKSILRLFKNFLQIFKNSFVRDYIFVSEPNFI